ncbi:uncharacterized mitochondrial protein-like protein isoform X2 [Tanacetum coccineum]
MQFNQWTSTSSDALAHPTCWVKASNENDSRAGTSSDRERISHVQTGRRTICKAKMRNALVPAPSFAPKPKNPPTPKKDNPAKDAICHQCGEVGHWRRISCDFTGTTVKNILKCLRNTKDIFVRGDIEREHRVFVTDVGYLTVPPWLLINVVDGKWVYRLKRDKNGAITHYKARFAAKGFRQQPGMIFMSIKPVVKSTTIQSVLSLAVTTLALCS